MLTNGELALMASGFGFFGVIVGAAATTAASRRQQRIDSNQRRHDRRLESYEQVLAQVLAAATSPTFIEDDPAWLARGMLLFSDKVRDALVEFGEKWPGIQAANEDPELRQELKEIAVRVAEVMQADLDSLGALPSAPRQGWLRRKAG